MFPSQFQPKFHLIDEVLTVPLSQALQLLNQKDHDYIHFKKMGESSAARLQTLKAEAASRFPRHKRKILSAIERDQPCPEIRGLRESESSWMRSAFDDAHQRVRILRDLESLDRDFELVFLVDRHMRDLNCQHLPDLCAEKFVQDSAIGDCFGYVVEFVNWRIAGVAPIDIVRNFSTPNAKSRVQRVQASETNRRLDCTMIYRLHWMMQNSHVQLIKDCKSGKDAGLVYPEAAHARRCLRIPTRIILPRETLTLAVFLGNWPALRTSWSTPKERTADEKKSRPPARAGKDAISMSPAQSPDPSPALQEMLCELSAMTFLHHAAAQWSKEIGDALTALAAPTGFRCAIVIMLADRSRGLGHVIVLEIGPLESGLFDPNVGYIRLPGAHAYRSQKLMGILALICYSINAELRSMDCYPLNPLPPVPPVTVHMPPRTPR